MVTIASDEKLEIWLEARPLGDAQIIAQRAALRVFPNAGRAKAADLTLKRDWSALPVLRVLLSSGVARKAPTPEVKSAAFASARAVRAESASFAYFASDAASSASAAARASTPAAGAVGYAEAYARDPATRKAFWLQFQADCDILLSGGDLDAIALWHGSAPDWFTQANAETLQIWDQDPAPWTFWRRWWQSRIDGTTAFPDDQLHDIALIPDEIWQQGPHAVMGEIAKIEERYALKAEVAALREQLQQVQTLANASASAAHRSHNQPPELIDDQAAAAQQITVIVSALAETEAELALPEPSASTLQRLAEVLLTGAKAIAFYCGKLADKALGKAAEELGSTGMKWLFRVGSASLLAQNQAVQDIAKAILSFAAKLNGS